MHSGVEYYLTLGFRIGFQPGISNDRGRDYIKLRFQNSAIMCSISVGGTDMACSAPKVIDNPGWFPEIPSADQN